MSGYISRDLRLFLLVVTRGGQLKTANDVMGAPRAFMMSGGEGVEPFSSLYLALLVQQ